MPESLFNNGLLDQSKKGASDGLRPLKHLLFLSIQVVKLHSKGAPGRQVLWTHAEWFAQLAWVLRLSEKTFHHSRGLSLRQDQNPQALQGETKWNSVLPHRGGEERHWLGEDALCFKYHEFKGCLRSSKLRLLFTGYGPKKSTWSLYLTHMYNMLYWKLYFSKK